MLGMLGNNGASVGKAESEKRLCPTFVYFTHTLYSKALQNSLCFSYTYSFTPLYANAASMWTW